MITKLVPAYLIYLANINIEEDLYGQGFEKNSLITKELDENASSVFKDE